MTPPGRSMARAFSLLNAVAESVHYRIPKTRLSNMEIQHHTIQMPHRSGVAGVYGVSIFRTGSDVAVVVITEPASNPGVSVTNAFEHIATKAFATYLPDVDPEQIIWVERYESASRINEHNRTVTGETFHLVSMEWIGMTYSKPSWRPIGKSSDQSDFWRVLFQTNRPLTVFPKVWRYQAHRV